MQRWQGALLAAALCSGCLEPLVDDQPGYSRHVLPAGSGVPSAYDDVQLARKIDMGDGLNNQTLMVKDGFAAGQPVKFWDLGPAKRSAVPAYLLARCEGGRPLPDQPVDHPLLIDTLPGDSDYSPFRTIAFACITASYAGQRITSLDALDDAIDLGLVLEPQAATIWRNLPVVNRGIGLNVRDTVRQPAEAYYKGKTVQYHNFLDEEGEFPNAGTIPTGYMYEIAKPGTMGVAKTIFSQPYAAADGSRNPRYSPQWIQVAVPINPMADKELVEAEFAAWDEDTDIVQYSAMGVPSAKTGTVVGTITVSQNRVNRPFLVHEVTP